ncbi:hypothetical protein RyT2_11860 [Pseudolactococcus yaeyamensis]
MRLKHRVQINVTDDKGNKQSVLKSGICSIPKKLLQFIIGEFSANTRAFRRNS